MSPRRRKCHATGRVASPAATRYAPKPPAAKDARPFWIYIRDPERSLMVSDGLNYIGEHCAQRQAAMLERYYGQPTEVRLSPRT